MTSGSHTPDSQTTFSRMVEEPGKTICTGTHHFCADSDDDTCAICGGAHPSKAEPQEPGKTKLEQVARAISLKLSEHNFVAGPLDPIPLARAAVEALREPTEHQSQLGGAVGKFDLIPVAANNPPVGQSIAERCWLAMIDSILNEPQTFSKPLPSSSGPEMTQQQVEAMERGRT